MRRLLACLLCTLSLGSSARDFSQDFAVVFATPSTEARFGRIPLDRALMAKAIEGAARDGAKGVVLKFFLDQSRTADGDDRLAGSLSRIPVILQARIDDSEQRPNELSERLTLGRTDYRTPVRGVSGWIPLPAFSEKSHGVCFADFDSSPIPILETYRGNTVKSLLLCPVELAIGQKAVIRPGSEVKVGDLVVPLDAQNRVSLKIRPDPALQWFRLEDLIDGTLPRNALKNRVVILGYDGPNIPRVMTPAGELGLHRAFVVFLKAFYENGN
jgi:adenylate cyclase